MDMKNNGSAYRRIKGFTLVELIVVIAIIAILAGVMNLATQGFIRNARREAANDNAHLVFTGFQNILTQCEINQDNSVISANYTNNDTWDRQNKSKFIIQFKVYDGNIQGYFIWNKTSNTTAMCKYDAEYEGGAQKYTDSTANSNKSKLPNAIMGIIDSSFEGYVGVYIDYENYAVKSVVYTPITESNKDPYSYGSFPNGDLKQYDSWYLGYDDASAQETAYKNHPLHGVYPFQSGLTTTP